MNIIDDIKLREVKKNYEIKYLKFLKNFRKIEKKTRNEIVNKKQDLKKTGNK